MTHTYQIKGMTCSGCVAKVKKALESIQGIQHADVQLASPQATLTMHTHIPIQTLQNAVSSAGNYSLTAADQHMHHDADKKVDTSQSWFATYRPILIIFGYVTLISVIAGFSGRDFDWMLAMRIFMSGFFLSFSFFKMLDLKGFADSYASYDIIAKQFYAWGFLYAFIELALGLSFAFNFQPLLTNAVTFVVMTISIIGVLRSVLKKQAIRCACLGTVFNLPMTTVTIIEDALMIVMSAVMLWVHGFPFL